jgi:hypothetical protein
MKKLELIDILNTQIAKENKFIEEMQAEENPQIKEMVLLSKGRMEAFEDVLYYAQHNSTLMFREA